MATILGDYVLYEPIASGGFAVVHLARKRGVPGFSPLVAIKRLKTADEAREALVAEALTSARITHANVVRTIDVVEEGSEILLVMELVVGVTLAKLAKAAKARGEHVPLPIACAIVAALLRGLEAAHEAKDLGLIHRDVSPQNVLVDEHGVAKLADFGVAKVRGKAATAPDVVKGKLAYMAPEYLRGEPIDARVDVYAAGVVLFETVTGQRAFSGSEDAVVGAILGGDLPAPSSLADVPAAIDDVVRQSVTRTVDARFASARDMRRALEAAGPLATASEIAAFVERLAQDDISRVHRLIATVEREATRVGVPVVRERQRSWVGPVVMVAALVGVVGAFVAWPRRDRRAPPVADAAPVVLDTDDDAAAPVLVTEPTTSSSAAPERRPSRPRRAPRSRACQPPWTIDDHGIKHYKDECL